ncbi:MAG: OsmC family peroxiredoxin [Micromonosporaceae bacterium]|nr:OsmC family peroxiredoxin [Micromonosporaceae bacterium]
MSEQTLRSVTLRRTSAGRFVATNARGVELALGSEDDTFSPVELLLAAIAGCTAIDVDTLTSRRAEPESFELRASGDKVRDQSGNRMENLEVAFRVRFPDGEAGDAARAVLPEVVARSHDRLCTVSRTIEVGTPIAPRIE